MPEPHIVCKMWNTDHEGRQIDPGKEAYPVTMHGPFPSLEEAVDWMNNEDDDDPDLFDAFVAYLNPIEITREKQDV